MEIEVPDYVAQYIQHICQNFDLDESKVTEKALKEFNDEFVQDDVQFGGDANAQWRYVLMILSKDYTQMIAVKQYHVVPVGFGGSRITKKGMPQSDIFAIVKNAVGEPKMSFRRIVCRGEEFYELYKNITYGSRYNFVEMTSFSWNDPLADLGVDERAKFADPVGHYSKKHLLEQLEKMESCKRVTCVEALKNPSKKRGKSEYVDSLDWRVIRAIVIDGQEFEKKSEVSKLKIMGGVYHATDHSLRENGAPFGRFTIWTPIELMTEGENSQCDFVGSVVPSKDRLSGLDSITMNCCMIVPIIHKPLGDLLGQAEIRKNIRIERNKKEAEKERKALAKAQAKKEAEERAREKWSKRLGETNE